MILEWGPARQALDATVQALMASRGAVSGGRVGFRFGGSGSRCSVQCRVYIWGSGF